MIENTSQRDPVVHLLGVMSDGQSAYITGMEAAGQRQLLKSEQFPTRCPQNELESLGFQFGPVDENDPIFRTVTLPSGWKREGSDHAMWSYIVDDKGRKRVSIFYKAAFYDRSAHAGVVSPSTPLSDALYADEPPTSVALDDLLTAEVARDWLDREEAQAREHIALVYADCDVPQHYRDRQDRVAKLRELVTTAAAQS